MPPVEPEDRRRDKRRVGAPNANPPASNFLGIFPGTAKLRCVSGLESIDVALFRFINLKLNNPLFDLVMPQLSANVWFLPALVLAGAWFLWKGGTRGRLFVLMLALVLGLSDTLMINRVKK